jgi:hypothetical protein
MRKIIIGLLLLLSVGASAQWQQTGSKVRYVNGIGIPTKDTAAGVSADSSQILIRPADSSLYVKYKRTWQKVGSGGGGTVTGTGTTNYISKWTSSTAIGNSQIFDNGTSMGIGTTSPSNKVDIFTTNRTALTAVGSGLNVNYNGSTTGQFATLGFSWNSSVGNNSTQWGMGMIGTNFVSGNADVNFFTDGVERMRITSAGRVGIDYTAPAAKLAVNGTALINTNTDNGVDKLQVSGSAIASTLKVNTSGQTVTISSYYNTGGGRNIWVGGGGLSSTSGDENTAIGVDAMLNNTSGYYNVAVGSRALKFINSGFSNVALGFTALENNTSGQRNVALGTNSLNSVVSGTDNFGLGAFAMQFTTGNKNIGVGSQVLYENTTGSSNIAFGLDAGRRISGGSANQTSNQSIFIGEDTRASAAGNTNEMVLGHTAIGQGSNTVTLGNSSITKTFLRGNTMVNTTTDNGVDELQVNGSIQGTGFNQAYTARTTTYTAANTDYFIDCTTGTFTVNLFTAVGNTGRILIIKNSGTGTITVDPNGSQTIDGATTQTLSTQWSRVHIISDGANWKIISN